MTSGHKRLRGAARTPAPLPETIDQLEAEKAQLQRAMESHAVVDQALGVIATVGRMTPDEAWDIIRETSMRTNIKLRNVAESLVAWAHSRNLSPTIRDALPTELQHRMR